MQRKMFVTTINRLKDMDHMTNEMRYDLLKRMLLEGGRIKRVLFTIRKLSF